MPLMSTNNHKSRKKSAAVTEKKLTNATADDRDVEISGSKHLKMINCENIRVKAGCRCTGCDGR
eukprot:13526742-Ditylum_brightwellii.AAC.1